MGIEEKEYNSRTVFIIVELSNEGNIFNIGVVVDTVLNVTDIKEEEIEITPDIGLKLKSQYLFGIATIEEKMVMILNIDKILNSDEIIEVSNMEVVEK